MTQEEKLLLLLKDLSARLPYGVKIKYLYWDEDKGCEYPVPMILDDINSDGYIRFYGDIKEGEGRGYILTYLPYLRPMLSMTEEEKEEVRQQFCYEWEESVTELMYYSIEIGDADCLIDWFLEHHFDFRGLISKGLALEALEGMYKQ